MLGTNRLLDFWPPPRGTDGAALMAKGTSAAALKGASAHVSGEFIVDAIRERWFGTDIELANQSGFSVSKLGQLKKKGATPKTRTFRALCRTLGMDATKAFQGHKVYVAEVSSNKRQDLHDLLNRLIGTPDETTLERVMRGLLKTG